MKLTDEQRTALAQARAEGRSRIYTEFTAEQLAEWKTHVAAAEAEKDDVIDRIRRQDDAAREPGFCGDLRRALLASGKGVFEIASELGIKPDLLEDFSTGDAILASDVIDRLVKHLGLRLMKELS